MAFTTQHSVLKEEAVLGTDRHGPASPEPPGVGAGDKPAGGRSKESEGRSGPGAHKGRRPRLLG